MSKEYDEIMTTSNKYILQFIDLNNQCNHLKEQQVFVLNTLQDVDKIQGDFSQKTYYYYYRLVEGVMVLFIEETQPINGDFEMVFKYVQSNVYQSKLNSDIITVNMGQPDKVLKADKTPDEVLKEPPTLLSRVNMQNGIRCDFDFRWVNSNLVLQETINQNIKWQNVLLHEITGVLCQNMTNVNIIKSSVNLSDVKNIKLQECTATLNNVSGVIAVKSQLILTNCDILQSYIYVSQITSKISNNTSIQELVAMDSQLTIKGGSAQIFTQVFVKNSIVQLQNTSPSQGSQVYMYNSTVNINIIIPKMIYLEVQNSNLASCNIFGSKVQTYRVLVANKQGDFTLSLDNILQEKQNGFDYW